MTLNFTYLIIIILLTLNVTECNGFGVKEEICAGQKDVMRRLSRDGKLCDGMEHWNTWFDMNYPDCREDMKWAESNLKNDDGVKVVKEESTTYNDNFIHGLNNLYEKGQKVETKQKNFLNTITGKPPLVEKGGNLQLVPKRGFEDSSRGRELISEWDGTAINGVFNLGRKVTKTSGTINVGGTLDITGIVGDDGVRPAIDGGRTHTVFHVNTNDELRLTNITIQNGYAGDGEGGGFYITGGLVTLTSSTVSSNTAVSTSGKIITLCFLFYIKRNNGLTFDIDIKYILHF